MLGAAKPNALSPTLARILRLLRRVGIGPDTEPPGAVGVTHEPRERLPDLLLARVFISPASALELGRFELQLSDIDRTIKTIDRHELSAGNSSPVGAERPRREIDLDSVGATHRRNPFSSGDDGRVGVRAAR